MKTAQFNEELALSGNLVTDLSKAKTGKVIYKSLGSRDYPYLVIWDIYSAFENEEWMRSGELLMLYEPVKKSCWVNIYDTGKVIGGFHLEATANHVHLTDFQHQNRVACIEISWEES